MSLAHPTDVPTTETRAASTAERTANRVAIGGAILGGLAAIGGGVLLWSREGIGVFMEVLAAGLSACF
jgi:hypothetical protein